MDSHNPTHIHAHAHTRAHVHTHARTHSWGLQRRKGFNHQQWWLKLFKVEIDADTYYPYKLLILWYSIQERHRDSQPSPAISTSCSALPSSTESHTQGDMSWRNTHMYKNNETAWPMTIHNITWQQLQQYNCIHLSCTFFTGIPSFVGITSVLPLPWCVY